jgi:2-succinyl-5-enolpyruvyl-6-hydroxy-3-cyclohexene-1-carboxylate synthase
MNNQDLTNYVVTFVQQLIDLGVVQTVISPGSRSTPLALVMSEHPDMKVYLNIDERSAGFFALGLAKKQKKPVALLCTSGTATANYYPAIVEAYYSRIPLIVITADRPHELRDVGAPQAINQINMYGKYVKWFVDASLPESQPGIIQYVKNIVSHAVFESRKHPNGPVHMNMPFREPLVPDLSTVVEKAKQKRNVMQITSQTTIDQEAIQRIADRLQTVKKGLIVCGELYHEAFSKSVIQLAEKLQYPILADPLSQLRFGEHSKEHVIEGYDTILKDRDLYPSLQPDVILRFGAMPVSKSLFLFLKEQPHTEQIIVDHGGGWRDPTLIAEQHLFCDEQYFCDELVKRLEKNEDDAWYLRWKKANDLTRTLILDGVVDESDSLFEGKLYIELLKWLPEECNLVVGNSMPIRDIDTFFYSSEKKIHIYANRGANGIDGVVSTAMGIGAASSFPTYLVIGDLSFFHDLNGLLAGKLHQLNITILLVNNNGGGIFSFLPQADEKKHFEALFGTPTDLDFRHAAAFYGANYVKVSSWDELACELKRTNQNGVNIIEIPTERYTRVKSHRKIMQFVSREIRKELEI